VLVGVLLDSEPRPARYEDPLEELGRLADTAGAEVVGRVVQRRRRADSSTFLGRGKAIEIAELARTEEVDVVILASDLSPAQVRNLEKILQRRVVDRTELILDIFALHARTHQAKLQVEMAQMQYLLPRLRRMWTHLSREGGTGQSSGIGTRGPGEKQIEIDRRILRRKIQELRRELARIAARRHRLAQARATFFTISLVGYTNAGKSTLLRSLTGAHAFVADQLFATLDTQTRAWNLPDGKKVFLSDTVGFIRDLPHHLVASLRGPCAACGGRFASGRGAADGGGREGAHRDRRRRLAAHPRAEQDRPHGGSAGPASARPRTRADGRALRAHRRRTE
jgi:GTP-binding protein HflX